MEINQRNKFQIRSIIPKISQIQDSSNLKFKSQNIQ